MKTRFPNALPCKIKAFYMQPDPENPEVVLAADLLAPEGYGEIIGGSQRIMITIATAENKRVRSERRILSVVLGSEKIRFRTSLGFWYRFGKDCSMDLQAGTHQRNHTIP